LYHCRKKYDRESIINDTSGIACSELYQNDDAIFISRTAVIESAHGFYLVTSANIKKHVIKSMRPIVKTTPGSKR
jgi:hypothetical protein